MVRGAMTLFPAYVAVVLQGTHVGERGRERPKYHSSRRVPYPFNAASDSNWRECAHLGGGSGSFMRPPVCLEPMPKIWNIKPVVPNFAFGCGIISTLGGESPPNWLWRAALLAFGVDKFAFGSAS